MVSDVRWALHLKKMRDTGNNMSTATRNTRLGQSLSVFVQQNKARNILYVIMKKLGKPLLVLRISHGNTKPIRVPFLNLQDEAEQRVAEPALRRVKLEHGRVFLAGQRSREGSLLCFSLLGSA